MEDCTVTMKFIERTKKTNKKTWGHQKSKIVCWLKIASGILTQTKGQKKLNKASATHTHT